MEAIGIGDFKSASPAANSPRKNAAKKPAADRKTMIPKKTALSITPRRIQLIFDELRTVKVEAAPNALSVLFRVFLELSVEQYMDKHKMPLTETIKGGHVRDKSLRAKINEVIAKLVQLGANKKDFNAVTRALSHASNPLSVDLLNDYVHNKFTLPKTSDLLAAWDESERLFEGLWS